MVRFCSVPQCTSTGTKCKDGVGFHKFPRNKDLCKAWIHHLKIGKKITPTMQVCSKHFTEEDYIQLEGYTYKHKFLKKQSIPSKNLPKASCTKNVDNDAADKRNKRCETRNLGRNATFLQNMARDIDVGEAMPPAGVDTETILKELTPEEKIINLENLLKKKEELIIEVGKERDHFKKLLEEQYLKNEQLNEENERLKQLKGRIFSMETIKSDKNCDNLVKYYTGLESYNVFNCFLKYIAPNNDLSHANFCDLSPNYLPLEDQLLAVLCKLRQNFGFKDLAFRFNKSPMGMSRLFNNWIHFLFFELFGSCKWPHRETLIINSPTEFRNAFPNVMAIIDGTEIYCQKANDLRMQSQTYSTYKSSNTFKGLIAVDQRGGIIFISNLMDGSISDKEQVKASGLLFLLHKLVSKGALLNSDAIMADKGFLISDLLAGVGINLIIPPFASSSQQMPVHDVNKTKSIAKFRVHVERAMARIKKFQIIAGVVPLNMIGNLNQIWAVVCNLANFQVPLMQC